ncbi:TPA: hypothetical protein ACPZDL_000668 [Citrobacter freundii]|uniref:hypothetical protein n=1 Tax=Citrobacter freundii TaxID=546 RepID=UPI0028EC41AE|nr:hypothetical protein [Citrobacter freundii]WNT04104.1 hypothetical protein RRL14_10110 [Citrobacter freundii]HCL6313882.1 hypothetical protein [Citrobacter freundii]
MTDEQMDDLMTLAVNMQREAETDCNRPSAMFAYAVQVAVLEIRETHSKYEELQSQNADLAVQLANAESKCRELAAECKTLSRFISGSCYVFDGDHDDDMPDEFIDASHYMPIVTPATDAFLAEERAQSVAEYASKRGFSFQHGSIHAHFGNGDVMVGSVTFENGDAGINFAPVRDKTGGVGTSYEWTNGKTTEQVDSVFTIASSNAEGLEVIRDKLSEAIAQLRKGASL